MFTAAPPEHAPIKPKPITENRIKVWLVVFEKNGNIGLHKHSLTPNAYTVSVPSWVKTEPDDLETQILNHPAYGTSYSWSARDFELGIELGQGRFGLVRLAREKKTGFLVAIKTMFKSQIMKSKWEKQVVREIEIQSHLKHPNILRLLTWFHDEKRMFMVLEYASGGELYKHLTKSPNNRFPESKAAKYIYQVADAVEYCHQNHVIHRDIKPENILVSFSGNLKLADFGFSVHAPSQKRKTMCGTLDYLPPEIIKGEVYDGSVDHWCIGVLLYEFLVGKPPFESETEGQTFAKILSLGMKYPDHVPEGAKDLISKLLRKSSKDRLSLSAVKEHPWVQKFRTDAAS